MKGVIPFLWFDTQAEEAANYYVSIFPGAKLGAINRFPAGGTRQPGGWLKDRYGMSWQIGAGCK